MDQAVALPQGSLGLLETEMCRGHDRYGYVPAGGASSSRSRDVDPVNGVPEEYAMAADRYQGEDAGRAYIASIDVPDTRMARIVLRPSWVGLIDFQTRNPSPLGGIDAQPRGTL